MVKRLRWELLGLAFLILIAPAATAAPALEPANTYGVIVGVLSWQNPAIGRFSTANRKDQELHDELIKRGVPRENLKLLLDNQATLANIRKSLRAVAGRARADATFVFYYAGHGSKLPAGDVGLLNYDSGPGQASLAGTEVADLLQQHFKGGRVLLLADCCHSGGLKAAAERLSKKGIAAASLTSADASNISTGNWTFTQTILDALRGDPVFDANADGRITLEETAREVAAAMKHREMQKAGYALHGLAADYELARTATPRRAAPPVGADLAVYDYVQATDAGGRNRPARIVEWKEGNYVVQFYDYTEKRTVLRPAGDLKKVLFSTPHWNPCLCLPEKVS